MFPSDGLLVWNEISSLMHGMEQIQFIFHVISMNVSPLKFYVHFSSAPCALSALPIPFPLFHYHNDFQFRTWIMKLFNEECFDILPQPLCRVDVLPSSLHSPRPLICVPTLTNVTFTPIHTNRHKNSANFHIYDFRRKTQRLWTELCNVLLALKIYPRT